MATARKIDAALFEQKWVDDLVAAGRPQYVLLFLYLVITCRNTCGIVEVNPRLWNFKLNPPTPFKGDDIFTVYGKRIRRIEGHKDKGIIVGFCDFQRNFSTQSKQFSWIEKDLAAVGLKYDDLKRFDEESAQQEFDLGLPPEPAPVRAHDEKPERQQRQVIPPKIEWVREYCESRKNGIDAQTFIDFYSARGWKLGKTSMKDWQAAVRTWEQRRKDEIVPKQATPVKNVVGNVRRMF